MRLTSLFTALLLVVALVGCGKTDKPATGGPVAGPNTPQPQPSDPKPTPLGDPQPKPPGNTDPKPVIKTGDDLAKVKPDVTMTAKEWAEEFAKDEKAAQTKYAGMVIELAGTVGFVGASTISNLPEISFFVKEKGQKTLTVVGGDIPDALVWEKVSEGSLVTLRGQCPANGTGWRLSPTIVTKAGANPTPTVAAAELAKEAKADVKAFGEKRLRNQMFYIEGEILKLEKDSLFGWNVTLKGDGDVNIFCKWLLKNSGDGDKYKVGQKLRMKSSLSVKYGDKDQIGLESLLVTFVRGL